MHNSNKAINVKGAVWLVGEGIWKLRCVHAKTRNGIIRHELAYNAGMGMKAQRTPGVVGRHPQQPAAAQCGVSFYQTRGIHNKWGRINVAWVMLPRVC